MTATIARRHQPRHAAERGPTSLTPAGHFVVTSLILTVLLVVTGVVGRVITGVWDAEKVIGVGFLAWFAALLMLKLWRWE